MLQIKLLIFLTLMTSFMVHCSQSMEPPLSRCHASATKYSQVGVDPLLFQFKSILYQVNAPLLGTMDGEIEIDTFQYFVYSRCQIMLYMVSRDVWLPEYFINMFQRLNVDNINIVCGFTQPNDDIENPIPLVLKLLRQRSELLSNDVPDWWYEGNRAIIAFEIKALPHELNSTFVCNTTFSHENVNVILNATTSITKAGCPIGHYGRNCTRLCFCLKPGQMCHALYGQPCYDQCPKGMRHERSYCEEVPTTTRSVDNTSQSQEKPGLHAGPEYRNAGSTNKTSGPDSGTRDVRPGTGDKDNHRNSTNRNYLFISLYMYLVSSILATVIWTGTDVL